MDARKCQKCGQEIDKWVEFCPNCSEPVEGYARPAGFWVRLGAYVLDFLVFIPIVLVNLWNVYSLKSTMVLVLITVPSLLYKPLMESFCGATLGKMACGLKVVDAKGNKLSVPIAYVRFFLFFLASAIGLASEVIRFSSPEFKAATTWMEAAQVKPPIFLGAVSSVVGLFVLVDCVFAAFTFRKRALHDMLAGSFCVYREP
jgi:uncharacterized RDD family membrane protein YckC